MKPSFEFDTVFPSAGGHARLTEVRKELRIPRTGTAEGTAFTQLEIDHLRTMFDSLSGDEEARSTLMGLICYCDERSKYASQQF